MSDAMRKIFGMVLAVILAASTLGLTACSSSSEGVRVDSLAPNFKLNDINDQSVSLSSFKGKSVLINFWAVSCSACVEEMPYLQAIHNDWSSKGDTVLLMVNVGEDKDTVKNFIQSNKYSFPVLLDSRLEIAEKYNVQYTPTSIFVNKEGNIKLIIIGAFKDKAAIEKQLASLLN